MLFCNLWFTGNRLTTNTDEMYQSVNQSTDPFTVKLAKQNSNQRLSKMQKVRLQTELICYMYL